KTPYDPAIPLLGICPEETKIERDTCIPLFIAALFTIARAWNQSRCPSIDEWIKKWYIYVMEYYSSVIQNEVSQKEKNRYWILTKLTKSYTLRERKMIAYQHIPSAGPVQFSSVHFSRSVVSDSL
uniref:Uncharacterized protein n=1 Tax=Moschus moschiferus TaxID=68415 RepID=A0A8C6CWH6_MOSMO